MAVRMRFVAPALVAVILAIAIAGSIATRQRGSHLAAVVETRNVTNTGKGSLVSRTLPAVLARAQSKAHMRARHDSPSNRSTGIVEIGVAAKQHRRRASLLQAQSDEDVVHQLSEELLQLQMEVDAVHLQCEQQRQFAARRAIQLQSVTSQAESEAAEVETRVARYAGELLPTSTTVEELRGRLGSLHATCQSAGAELVQSLQEAKREFQRARELGGSVKQLCQGAQLGLAQQDTRSAGKLLLRASAALRGQALASLSRRLRLAHTQVAARGAAVRSGTRRARLGGRRAASRALPPAAALPEPPPTADGATVPAPSEPTTCAQMFDTFDQLEYGAKSKVAEATANLAKHEQRCRAEAEDLNAELHQKVGHLSQMQALLGQAVSARLEIHEQARSAGQLMREAARSAAEKQRDCTETLEQLEREACDVMETRQAMAWSFLGISDDSVIEDCKVGDWTTGPCSKSCAETPESSGSQVMTRPVILEPDRTTLLGRLGSRCPPTEQVSSCNEVPCPVDCVVNEWSDWAGCSRMCGGGEQYRTRSVQRPPLHNGMGCGATIETRTCNGQACRTDCVLGTWGAWSPCSKRCRWGPEAMPGHALRTRPVVVPASSGGSCPREAERREYRECNTDLCPSFLGALTCTADQDIVALLDGSGSVDSGEAGQADQNFERQKELLRGLLQYSSLAAAAGEGGVRYGLVVFGGPGRPHVASPLSGDRTALLAGLAAAPWPGGATSASWGLQTAARLLEATAGSAAANARHSTVLLVTDGRLRQPHASIVVARRLQESGVRVLVVLVQSTEDEAAAATGRLMCRMASSPCVDNVMQVNQWQDLPLQLGRFLAAVCPVGFPPVRY